MFSEFNFHLSDCARCGVDEVKKQYRSFEITSLSFLVSEGLHCAHTTIPAPGKEISHWPTLATDAVAPRDFPKINEAKKALDQLAGK